MQDNQTNQKKRVFPNGISFVKLTKKQAEEIRILVKGKILLKREICERYGITYPTLKRITSNESYTDANPTHLKRLPYFGQKPTKTRMAKKF